MRRTVKQKDAWEKAQKVYLKQQQMGERNRPTVEEETVEKDTPQQGNQAPQQAETTPLLVVEDTNPLTPLIPGDETPIEGGSATEEINTEDERPLQRKEEHRSGDTTAWHKNTRPAEPSSMSRRQPDNCAEDGGTVQLKLDQLSYYAAWLGKETEFRHSWEKEPIVEEKDTEMLAWRIQHMDGLIGHGATYACIKSQMDAWLGNDGTELTVEDRAPDTGENFNQGHE